MRPPPRFVDDDDFVESFTAFFAAVFAVSDLVVRQVVKHLERDDDDGLAVACVADGPRAAGDVAARDAEYFRVACRGDARALRVAQGVGDLERNVLGLRIQLGARLAHVVEERGRVRARAPPSSSTRSSAPPRRCRRRPRRVGGRERAARDRVRVVRREQLRRCRPQRVAVRGVERVDSVAVLALAEHRAEI